MSAVPEEGLGEYLRFMRRQHGYSIVGLEQTDSSVSLMSCRAGAAGTAGGLSTSASRARTHLPMEAVQSGTFRFPQRCILLLGKEKEGIPVALLQELDLCIEIPQFGVIRSLNVHVSAALVIWEITRQNEAVLSAGR